MKIYGVYTNDKFETCLCIGDKYKLAKFLEVSPYAIKYYASRKQVVQKKYRVYSLYNYGGRRYE